jgi:hypothetical protein
VRSAADSRRAVARACSALSLVGRSSSTTDVVRGDAVAAEANSEPTTAMTAPIAVPRRRCMASRVS